MRRLTFAIGGNIRKVVIDNRVLTFLSAETGFTPIRIDLDQLGEKQKQIEKNMGEDGMKFMKEVALLKTEDDMEKDIIKDFQSTGWRCVMRE